MNFIDNQVFARVSNALVLPEAALSVVLLTVRTVRSIAGTTLAVAFLGYSKSLNKNAAHLNVISCALPNLLGATVKVLNPDSTVKCDHALHGLLTTALADRYIKEKNHTDRRDAALTHTFTRRDLIGLSLGTTVSKVIDVALGVIALPFVCVSFGQIDRLNQFAMNQFRALDVISLPFITAFGLIDPKSAALRAYYFPR